MKRGSKYIGFTGLSCAADVNRLSAMARPAHTRLMAGVLVSGHRTLAGRSGSGPRYPNINIAAKLAEWAELVAWPVVHYNSRDGEPLDSQLARLINAIPHASGVQMNMVAPDPDALAAFRSSHPQVEFILQVSPGCIDASRASSVDEYVMRYRGIAEHALLDLSCGRGVSMDESWASSVLASFGEKWLMAGIRPALAGGLGPDCKDTVRRVASAIGELVNECSWDAESGLRAEDDTCLDANKMARYLMGVVGGIEEARP